MKYLQLVLATGVSVFGIISAACAATSFELTGVATETCLCDSTYMGATCNAQTDPLPDYNLCPSYNNAIDKPREVLVTQESTTLQTLVGDRDVSWTVKWPAGLDRIFTGFSVGTCLNGANLESFVQTSVPDLSANPGCLDEITFTMKLTDLRGACGFEYTLADHESDPDIKYANYTEQIVFKYQEPTIVATNIVTRSGMVVIPTSILVRNRVTAETAEVKVYSPFVIDTALTAQAINEGASASHLTLTYVLSKPYSVLTMNPVLANTGGTLNQAFICEQPNGGGACGLSANSGTYIDMEDCVAEDYALANNGCAKIANIELVHGQCTLDGTYTITDVVIDCYKSLPEAECPINQQNRDTTIEFVLSSDNFCGENAEAVLIESAVAIDQFIFVDPENRQRLDGTYDIVDLVTGVTTTKPSADTPITAIEFGQFAYARVDFSKLDVTAVTIISSQARESNLEPEDDWADTLGSTYPKVTGALVPDIDYTATRVTIADPNPFDAATTYEGELRCPELGLCVVDQTFLIRYLISDAVHPKFANPGLGKTTGFDLRLLVDVSYETDGASAPSRRRRRRQTTTDGNTSVQDDSDPSQDGQGPASITASGDVQGSDDVANTNAAGNVSSSTIVLIAMTGLSLALPL
ncbi:hypothetical protein SARC_01958 [Sphaeroforma arctica JP610]|uniref:EGF-like domain-containing protein n=1 Tax=Sphaeroforma arctica JP610 TaxID=667725 RepID=A0A0L0GA19_9EUKA|nr:hypothetical protein SARC_01958 [Sphaeroforma arctica JP610]KNC85882.1 hypothetical protein SARC_01958 [Sphaeroforma arctica JP610]|eukprot:XP_014159784.1 hypothetical protein SARC_01958 [Sphaeroforma arctica JP610]